MAKLQLSGQQQGYAAAPQQGYAAEPRPGPPQGYAAQPRPGPPGGWQGGGSQVFPGRSGDDSGSLGDDLAGAAMSAAAGFIGRAIGRRVQRTFEQRVLPNIAARQEAVLRAQIAIAEQHPDLRACLTDKVIFLAGGSRALPMPNLGTLTVDQADALVATLQNG